MFSPNFTISPAITRFLMAIEADRQALSDLPISVALLESLRGSSRLVSTHYSTQIEGNRLTQAQVKDVLKGGTFPNRKRDEKEVRDYFRALEYVERLSEQHDAPLDEKTLQVIHGLVMEGKEKPSPYRDGQNVIRDAAGIVYMPPEATDVEALMGELVEWINTQVAEGELPTPMIAAMAHYQFATIHPYYDGNGRSARLLTNLILHRGGYGLNGIYSLEEYYAKNLQGYYEALTVGESHNYYLGRAEADISGWLHYFCESMADAFAKVRVKAAELPGAHHTDDALAGHQQRLFRELGPRQKQVLSLFRQSRFVTTSEIAKLLGVQPRAALNLCKQWMADGFLIRHGEAKRSRKYELAEKWVELVV